MPIQEGKVEMPCMVNKNAPKTHSCCTILDTKENKSEKKDCCSGTSKMSCCVSVIAIAPQSNEIIFLSFNYLKIMFGYTDIHPSFVFEIFHPPTIV